MKLLRILLLPISILYGLILWLRNYLYDCGWLASTKYNLPVISVGNLSVGGTGKSPMIEFLISFIKEDYKLAVLSRGYKRKTEGFLEVSPKNTAKEVGDEPLQFKTKFPNVTVAVCADRRTGIEKLKHKADVILLDDAFQHRKVQPSLHILLTPFYDLFMDDTMLPTGNLREPKQGYKRTQIIVVTKCPENVSSAKMQEIEKRINLQPSQKLYFSKIGYSETIHSADKKIPLNYLNDKKFTLVTGIANPTPLLSFLKESNFNFEHLKFPDHYNFSQSEIEKFEKREIILTTEKDFMRLRDRISNTEIYYLPIVPILLGEKQEIFKKAIIDHVETMSN